ncbi:MAG TPA: Tm-1-like ATP-binding domain-containing protein, partial [Prosthecobacter sp.]|nr:Tm-1-like ATP-binding domain-containing protein [Prosthecobacter sp.]
GTAIGTSAMRALPVGVPKVMVSTVASGDTRTYVGAKDIAMLYSVVDVAGINRISAAILTNAAGAVVGMVEAEPPKIEEKPIITASMFGNTTALVDRARKQLEEAGYEVLVFHATGSGGQTMESLIADGFVQGVFDVTTTEWADELCGGVFAAGRERLDAAARAGVPQVIAPGCLDMVNFGERASVPEKFVSRLFYQHNPQVTLMRTTPEECAQLGRILAEKVNAYTAPVTVLLPTRAISVISAPGKPFHDPAADAALFEAIKSNLRPDIPVIEMDCEINSPDFAAACAQALLNNLKAAS